MVAVLVAVVLVAAVVKGARSDHLTHATTSSSGRDSAGSPPQAIVPANCAGSHADQRASVLGVWANYRPGTSLQEAGRAVSILGGGIWSCVTGIALGRHGVRIEVMGTTTTRQRRAIAAQLRRTGVFASSQGVPTAPAVQSQAPTG